MGLNQRRLILIGISFQATTEFHRPFPLRDHPNSLRRVLKLETVVRAAKRQFWNFVHQSCAYLFIKEHSRIFVFSVRQIRKQRARTDAVFAWACNCPVTSY